jgi:hypothetical protein
MTKREASVQPLLTAYVHAKRLSGIFELKYMGGESIRTNVLLPQQLSALEEKGATHKISDIDPRLKPCDLISVYDQESAVVVYHRKKMYFVEIEQWKTQKAWTLHELKECAYRIVGV